MVYTFIVTPILLQLSGYGANSKLKTRGVIQSVTAA
jgi:hypothetical protein